MSEMDQPDKVRAYELLLEAKVIAHPDTASTPSPELLLSAYTAVLLKDLRFHLFEIQNMIYNKT